MKPKKKRDVSGGESLTQDLFSGLGGIAFPDAPTPAPQAPESAASETKRASVSRGKRGRIEIRREKSGRGGKTVTTAKAFQGVCPAEQEAWVAELKKKLGTGGTSRPGAIEIQGDRREEVVRFFEEKGFRAVLAGG